MALLEPKPKRAVPPEELTGLEQDYDDVPALSQLTGTDIERLRGLFNKLPHDEFIDLVRELDWYMPKGVGDGRLAMAAKRALAAIDKTDAADDDPDALKQSGGAVGWQSLLSQPPYVKQAMGMGHPAVKEMRGYLAAKDAYATDIKNYKDRQKGKGLRTGVPRLRFGGEVPEGDMDKVWELLADDVYSPDSNKWNAATLREERQAAKDKAQSEWKALVDDSRAREDADRVVPTVEQGVEAFEDDIPWEQGWYPDSLSAEDGKLINSVLGIGGRFGAA